MVLSTGLLICRNFFSSTNPFKRCLPSLSSLLHYDVRIKRNLSAARYVNFLSTSALPVGSCTTSTLCRWKHSKKSAKQEVESDSDNEEEEESENVDEVEDKISKVMSTTISSLRVDLILKAGLGIARNKVEVMFYESKIRVNGEKILKKSYQCQVGDEVDIVRGPSPTNPEFLVVSRVEILSATEKGEKLAVKLRRYKSLVIENYAEPWKSSQQEEH